ncbi:MAG: hypothetical protein WCN98_18785 [Verrucomicrobiaceae bacterium]
MTYALNELALIEYHEAAQWYKDRSLQASENFIGAIEFAIKEILKRPDCYQPVGDEIRVFRLKKYPYKIHYLLEGDHVTIYSVTSTHRQPDYWRKRLPGKL